ncbi:MAG TPA: hypothetical protein VFB96_03180 [Pirellulaceae bacterium]|jgi:hypothetical protein|nr:hypothetical protein [Pirellulaceae bacterium]
MNNHEDNSGWGTGCAVVLSLCVILLLCGGGLVVLVGGSFYMVQRQAIEARQAAMEARQQAIMAELQAAGGLAETPLPPGAHVIAIGPDGELFWDNQPVDEQQLKQTLNQLAPSQQRASVPIYIRPGLGAPDEAIDKVCSVAADYHQVVEPPPASQIHIAPEPGEDQPPVNARPKK